MSYVPKKLKKFPSENVGVENGNTKGEVKGCSLLDLNRSFEEMDPELNLELNSTNTIKLNPPKASEPPHGRHVKNHEELRYGCRYCTKKFAKRQALGGHQNAHKLKKVMEQRVAWQGREVNLGTGENSRNGVILALPSCFNEAPKMMNSPNYSDLLQHQMYAHGYPGYMSPMSPESGFVELSSFCTSPASPPFMSTDTRMGQGASTSKGKSIAIEENDQAEHYREINNVESQHREDDIDLSLKL